MLHKIKGESSPISRYIYLAAVAILLYWIPAYKIIIYFIILYINYINLSNTFSAEIYSGSMHKLHEHLD